MRSFLALSLAVAAIGLSSCANAAPPATPASYAAADMPLPATVATVEGKVILEGARALTLAALAYEGTVTIVRAAKPTGERAAMIQRYNRDILNALELGERAVTNADKARYAAAIFKWVDGIKALTGT